MIRNCTFYSLCLVYLQYFILKSGAVDQATVFKSQTLNNRSTNGQNSLFTSSGVQIFTSSSNRTSSRHNIDKFFNIILNMLNNRTLSTYLETESPIFDEPPTLPPSLPILVPSSNSFLSSIYNNCSPKQQQECCSSIVNSNTNNKNGNFSFICYQCKLDNNEFASCPCLCSTSNLATEIFSVTKSTNAYLNRITNDPLGAEFSDLNYEITLNFYSLMLSIGLPCLVILMIMLSLVGLAYCYRRFNNIRNRRNNSNRDINSRGSPGCESTFANTNLSFIYTDIDAENSRKINEEPPKYNEIFQKSQQVDKLPTYKSFRAKFKNKKTPFLYQ
jgi:hypothetical protein